MEQSADAILVIDADRSAQQYWQDMWRFRELALFLAWRDIIVRYKQTVIGIAWAVIRPVLQTAVLYFVFVVMQRLNLGGSGPAAAATAAPKHAIAPGAMPHLLVIYIATLVWQLFADVLGSSSNSMISAANMLSKVYFPRLLMPLGRTGVSFVDFAISLLLMAAGILYFHFLTPYHFTPSPTIVFLPIFAVLAALAALGPGLLFGALNVKYRDFVYIIPFIIQIGFFASPVGYQSYKTGVYRRWYSLNPMVGVIDGARWCLFGNRTPIYPLGMAMSLVTTAVFLCIGVWYFRKMERTFADIV